MSFVKVLWALLVASATNHLEGQMAVRWCAVGGAMIQHVWSASSSANVSLNGAAPLSVKTAKRLWTYIPAKLRNEPSGWTRPETWPCHLPQDLLWSMVFWDMMSILHGASPWSLFLVAWLYYNSVKALQLKNPAFPMSALHTKSNPAHYSASLLLSILWY